MYEKFFLKMLQLEAVWPIYVQEITENKKYINFNFNEDENISY